MKDRKTSPPKKKKKRKKKKMKTYLQKTEGNTYKPYNRAFWKGLRLSLKRARG